MEVAPLVVSVNDLLERLKESIVTQKRFLADAAHQLKTPLAGLRMQADLAQRSGSSEEDLKKSLQADWTRQRSGHPHREPVVVIGTRRRRRRAPVTNKVATWSHFGQRCLTRLSASAPWTKVLDLGYEGVDPGTFPGAQVHGQPHSCSKKCCATSWKTRCITHPARPSDQGVVTVRVLVDPYSKALVMCRSKTTVLGIPVA